MRRTTLFNRASLIGLLAALLAPATAYADGSCGRLHAEYRLDWTANMDFETNVAGVPTLGYAKSALGPDLPVAFHYGGKTERFSFDSPKVASEPRTNGGVMEWRHHLASHHETTRVELWFDRDVHALRIDVHDFDEDPRFPRTYADRLGAVGVARDHQASLARVDAPGKNPRQDAARHAYLAQRQGTTPIQPVPAPTYSENDFSPLTLHFDAPVHKLMLSLGSEAGPGTPRERSHSPAEQRVFLGDVTFCVALDNS
mgnify:CR=1 FL=1|jgi:hypothetical protein